MILRDVLEKLDKRFERFSAFLPAIGRQLKIAIENGDAEGVRARTQELREAADAVKTFADKADAVLVDGFADAVEGVELALALDHVVDEFEDVIKGYDEDDVDPGPTPAVP